MTNDEACWHWLKDFAARLPALRNSPEAMAYLDAMARLRPRLPRRLSLFPRYRFLDAPWYRALGTDEQLIEEAWDAAHDPRPGRTRQLLDYVSRAYTPSSCALGTTALVSDEVRRWGDGTVLRLAAGVEAGDVSPGILADALLDAGCGNDELASHLRGEERHQPFCWATRGLLAVPAPRRRGRARKLARRGGARSGARPLGGVRLGSAERRILLALADGARAVPPSATRSRRETWRQAAGRLMQLGLVADVGGRLVLTPLGRGVMQEHGEAIRGGRRIRWA
jgi:hypothetical protein